MSQYPPNFHVEGDAPTNHFRTANACLTTLSLTVFTQRNFVADFLKAEYDFTWKTAVLRFAFGGLGTTYDDYLRLTGKRVVDVLLMLIELFC